jgi:UDP-N-acetylglucosamine--N-acetylmuramyl-(pentapeptide) pyrophosphoryl-undecaprenol N-acetylglucosamine transferase
MKMIIAGGGTGGHLFPGVAIAEEFLRRDGENRVLFIGTEKGLESRVLKDLGYDLRTVTIEGLKGRGLRAVRALFKIPWSLIQSAGIIRAFFPDMVIGVGGYASGPAVMAAWFMGIPTAVAEQNALPGVTNRILSRFVRRVFVSFTESLKWLPAEKTGVTGNPIRAGFFKGTGAGRMKDGRFVVLVFGGSQGAHRINEAVMEALPCLEPLKDRLRFIHQTGGRDGEAVKEAYRQRGIEAEVLPFIRDMALAYGSADLLICRAGATSIAEITACGKAAVFIPFPYAIHDHQTGNARVLVEAGAAEMIAEKDLDGRGLAQVIERLSRDPERIRLMEEKARSLGHPGAASDIVEACMELVKPER